MDIKNKPHYYNQINRFKLTMFLYTERKIIPDTNWYIFNSLRYHYSTHQQTYYNFFMEDGHVVLPFEKKATLIFLKTNPYLVKGLLIIRIIMPRKCFYDIPTKKSDCSVSKLLSNFDGCLYGSYEIVNCTIVFLISSTWYWFGSSFAHLIHTCKSFVLWIDNLC